MKKLKKKVKKPDTQVNIRGITRHPSSTDKVKKTICVFGVFDGKRIEFDNSRETIFAPYFTGEKTKDGFEAMESVKYISSDFKVNGKVFRVFHPTDRTKDEVFLKLMDSYIGKAQKEMLLQRGVALHKLEKVKSSKQPFDFKNKPRVQTICCASYKCFKQTLKLIKMLDSGEDFDMIEKEQLS